MRLVLLVLFVLAACAQASHVCTEPYIQNGNTCCLDKDASGICDIEEGSMQQEGGLALDCSLCAPQFVTDTREKVVYKYVCLNESVFDDPTSCYGAAFKSDAGRFEPMTRENGPDILDFSVRPACRGSFKAAEVHIELGHHPQRLSLQVMREPGTSYETLTTVDGTKDILDEKYLYLGFCDDVDCDGVTDAQLPATKAYMLRIVADFASDKQYTEEIVLDPTPTGKYSQQIC